jgi:hypothetical protein
VRTPRRAQPPKGWTAPPLSEKVGTHDSFDLDLGAKGAVSAQETLMPGSTIADFRIASLVRSAGEAQIYAAEQASLGRRVTLVVLSADSGSEPGERFVEAARRLASFEHPNVLPVYEVGHARGVMFAATREPPGRSLEALVRDGTLTPSRSADLADTLDAALGALGRAGIGALEPTTRDVFVTGADELQIAALEALASSPTVAPDESAEHVLSELASGSAVAPTRSSRRRVGLAVAALSLAAAVVGAIAILTSGGDDATRPAPVRRASPSAPGALLAATIPVNGTPGSMAVGEGAAWVATLEGSVLRIDPRTNRVTGAPIRFAREDQRNNVTVRTGAGAVFALDGNRGRIVRIDPRSSRVTARRTLGGIVSGATVADGVVWVLHWQMRAGRPVDEVVRLDAATLRPVGSAAPIGNPMREGPQASDVEAAGGVAWVTNATDGTITRFDGATGQSTTIRVGGSPLDSALVGGTLWVPDVWSGSLTPVDALAMRLPDASLHADYPFSAAATDDALWVIAQTGNAGPGGPERLYRVDPRSRAILGRAVDVGSDLGWIVAGADSVWLRSAAKRAVMRFAATSPPPRPHPVAPAQGTPPRMATGPLRAGTWTTNRFSVPFAFSVGRGWLAVADDPTGISIARTDSPRVEVNVYAPAQVFTPAGKVRRLRSPEQAVALVVANPHLVVTGRRQTTVGGVPATQLDVRVRPYRGYPRFCQSACVVLFGLPASSAGIEADLPARLWFLRSHGRTVVVSAEVDRHEPGPAVPQAVVSSMHFR